MFQAVLKMNDRLFESWLGMITPFAVVSKARYTSDLSGLGLMCDVTINVNHFAIDIVMVRSDVWFCAEY